MWVRIPPGVPEPNLKSRISNLRFENMVGVAQMAERLIVDQDVAGSSPATHPE